MKGVLVVIDGLADLPCKQLKGKTPLEAANKPNLDYLAERGKIGRSFCFGKGIIPESDSSVLALLGNEHLIGYRGVFEALGIGVALKRGDLALRTNFATIDNLEERNILERRAGRLLTTNEAKILAKELNRKIKLTRCFEFFQSIQHRGVLILRGGFSDNITNTDPAYKTKVVENIADKLNFSEPLDDDENSKFSANIVNEFVEQSFKVLNNHWLNNERRKKGLLPANVILTRDASNEIPEIKKFEKWAAIAYMPLEIGIAKASEMKVFSFDYPDLKDYDIYNNLYDALDRACDLSIKTIKKQSRKFDYFYIHIKETDIPGHDNKPLDKKKMIETIDRKLFFFLRKFCEKSKVKIVVTADHSTPCILKSHSSDPVPILVCDWIKRERKEFSEKAAENGGLGELKSKEVLLVAGFIKK